MYCSYCGAKLTQDAKFCEHCGTPAAAPGERPCETPPPAPRTADRDSARFLSIAVAAITALLMLVCVAKMTGLEHLRGELFDEIVSRANATQNFAPLENMAYLSGMVSFIISFTVPILLVSIFGFMFSIWAVSRKTGGAKGLLRFSYITAIISGLAGIVVSVIWNSGQDYTSTGVLYYATICLLLSIAGLIVMMDSIGLMSYRTVHGRQTLTGLMPSLIFFGVLSLGVNGYHQLSMIVASIFGGAPTVIATQSAAAVMRPYLWLIAAITLLLTLIIAPLLRSRLKYYSIALICAGIGAVIGSIYAVIFLGEGHRLLSALSTNVVELCMPIAVSYVLLHTLIGLFTAASLCGRMRIIGLVTVSVTCLMLLIVLPYGIVMRGYFMGIYVFFGSGISILLTILVTVLFSLRKKNAPE